MVVVSKMCGDRVDQDGYELLCSDPPTIPNLLRGAFRYPTGIDFRSNSHYFILYCVCYRLIVGSDHIARSDVTSSNETPTLF